MKHTFTHLDKPHTVVLEQNKDGYVITIGGQAYAVSSVVWHENAVSYAIDAKRYTVFFARSSEGTHLSVDGEYFLLTKKKSISAAGRRTATGTGDSVSSPMPGLIVKIPVTIGVRVTEGTTLAIVEAMKMQNELRAPRDGTVKRINFKEGEQIDALKPIVELEP